MTRRIGFRVSTATSYRTYTYWTAPSDPDEWEPPHDAVEVVRCEVIRFGDLHIGTLGYLGPLEKQLFEVTRTWTPLFELGHTGKLEPARDLGLVILGSYDGSERISLAVSRDRWMVVPVARVPS